MMKHIPFALFVILMSKSVFAEPPTICFFNAHQDQPYGHKILFETERSAERFVAKLRENGSDSQQNGKIVLTEHPTREGASDSCMLAARFKGKPIQQKFGLKK